MTSAVLPSHLVDELDDELSMLIGEPLDDIELVEEVLAGWQREPDVPEFWAVQMLDNLCNLFTSIQAELVREDSGFMILLESRSPGLATQLAERRAETRALIPQIRCVIDQLWHSEWPHISDDFARDVTRLLAEIRKNEEDVANIVGKGHAEVGLH